MENKKRFRGFTLVELIVVIAVFGLLMAAALAILGPVSDIYKSTYTYADSVAVVDNVAMYLEDNLRYANRMDICDVAIISNETGFRNAKVSEFVSRYHLNDSTKISNKVDEEIVYLMKIDNPDPDNPGDTLLLNTPTLDNKYINSGKISVWKYSVKESKWLDDEYKEWAVNRQFYNDYTFTSFISNTRDKGGAESLNFTLNINMYHNDRKGGVLTQITNTKLENTVSFPLVNLVDASGMLQETMFVNTGSEIKELPKVNRYFYRDTYSSGDPSDGFVKKGNDIYIMYTQCPSIEDE